MKHNRLCLLTVSLVFMMALTAFAQRKPERSAKKPDPQQVNPANEEKVKDLVAFFQLLLNTLGSSSTSVRDKDIIITESYTKIFRDSKVQVEDDLDESRSAITNKDVVAYLKDVDFFFEDVRFELLVDNIQQGVNANGQVFYKVSGRRILEGTTATGNKVKNTMPRFVEINYDANSDDLKIVSVYSNEFDEKESLTGWWNSLSLEWRTLFKKRLNIADIDSVSLNNIKDMMALNELDLSNNEYIQSIEPLSQLTNLRMLNLSGTNVEDLTPIRNLTELVELDLSRTKVLDLTPLRYATKLERLNISNTDVRSIAALEKMTAMRNFEMQATHVFDFEPLNFLTGLVYLDLKRTQIASLSPIQNLTTLMELNVAQTSVQDLGPLRGLTNLVTLNIDSSLVREIGPLASLTSLEVLYANYTFITDLTPLQNLARLTRIYCDQTPIKKPVADAFMVANPEVLVIFDSRDLNAWWNSISHDWKTVLGRTAGISMSPTKEELARLPHIDSINFSNERSISSLEPLRRLQKLRVVLAANTAISDLSPIGEHRAIRYLDISDTGVEDLSPVEKFTQLEVLRADRSKIQSIEPLFNLKKLRVVYVDRTAIHDITAREFLERNADCLLVYKTIHLDRWWKNLPDGWKDVFLPKVNGDTTRESLHRLVELEAFHFRDVRVRDLSALSEFVRLRELHFSGTAISEIPDLETLRSLKSLHATSSPLQRIGAIALLSQLEDLDISNTPIDDLRGLEVLENLRTLNCAGTQVRKLDPLRRLVDLQSLDCSNTSVSKLDPVMYLSLRTLKAYNTKISNREIERFRQNNPECDVTYYR